MTSGWAFAALVEEGVSVVTCQQSSLSRWWEATVWGTKFHCGSQHR